MNFIYPTLHLEKKTKTIAGKDLIETNLSFNTQFCLQVWDKWVIMRVTVLGFGFLFKWSLNGI